MSTESTETPPQPPNAEPVVAEQSNLLRILTPYGAMVSFVFLILWLLPITWVGGTKGDVRYLPLHMRQQHRVACLFTNRVTAWKTYHIQAQMDGSDEWVEIDEAPYFVMDIFGYRSRWQRIMSKAYRKAKGLKRTRVMANWIHDHWEEHNPDGRKLDAIRYVRITHRVKDLAKETGPFRKRTLKEFHPNKWVIFGEVRWDKKRPKHPTHEFKRNVTTKKGAAKGKNSRAKGKGPFALPPKLKTLKPTKGAASKPVGKVPVGKVPVGKVPGATPPAQTNPAVPKQPAPKVVPPATPK